MRKTFGLLLGLVLMLSLVAAVGCSDDEIPNDAANDSDVATATSLQYSVEWSNDETGDWTFMAKDIGTEDAKLRWEGTVNGHEDGFIINGELKRVWNLEDGTWVEVDIPAEMWDMYWEGWWAMFEGHRTELLEWTDGDWTYTDPETGYSVRIYDVQVDPTLTDALFEP